MEIRNNINRTNYHQNFGAKLGATAEYYLQKTPEKLNEVTKRLLTMGEPTSVVEIMSKDTKKGKIYSLRLFNEVFGLSNNVSILKDNKNNDVVSYFARDFIPKIESLTKNIISFREDALFRKIAEKNMDSKIYAEYLYQIISIAKKEGKELSREVIKRYF